MTTRTRTTTAALALALTLALTACASGGDAGAEASGDGHNQADVDFAQMMIVHHRGALAMTDMVEDRSTDPELLALAERISAAQGPEIDTMTSWLENWDEDVPEGTDMSMGGMDHGDTMPGMMTDEQMDDLGGADGTGFDEMFLTMMIEHHEGAVEMSETQLDEGLFPDALALAESIIESQTAEIAEMQAMLDS